MIFSIWLFVIYIKTGVDNLIIYFAGHGEQKADEGFWLTGEAREDDDIDAIVLRVDSGGGSALASDMMWREVFKTTDENQICLLYFVKSVIIPLDVRIL